jgi:predicted DNA-binding transcriptional regulator YafY
MLLQTRGQMTAQQLADELEVSERTIYRDIDALCASGVPVYADHGPGGGYALLDSYRTNLTGLTREEVRALFMLSTPAPLKDLGLSQELKAALLKLAAALPAARRDDEERVRQRVHLDPVGWFQQEAPVPHLQTIQKAVWDDHVLHLTYRLPFNTQVERPVHPYGLVAKAGAWYLVGARDRHILVYRVSSVLDARVSKETFERPADFDLSAFWQAYCVKYENNRPTYPATVRAAPDLLPLLKYRFGDSIQEMITQGGRPDAEGWIELTLPFETLEDARECVLGYGRAIKVLEPKALRDSVIDFASQIHKLYRGRD